MAILVAPSYALVCACAHYGSTLGALWVEEALHSAAQPRNGGPVHPAALGTGALNLPLDLSPKGVLAVAGGSPWHLWHSCVCVCVYVCVCVCVM